MTDEQGSPPRARGKAHLHQGLLHGSGITPACAGKRRSASLRPLPRRDHPRVRGEKCCGSSAACCASGSPPRARGKALVVLPVGLAAGITPACAGKSCFHPPIRIPGRDHPRVRGESCFETRHVSGHRDHPRLSGKKADRSLTIRAVTGSPRMRGEKTAAPAGDKLGEGSTPACAGKSLLRIHHRPR